MKYLHRKFIYIILAVSALATIQNTIYAAIVEIKPPSYGYQGFSGFLNLSGNIIAGVPCQLTFKFDSFYSGASEVSGSIPLGLNLASNMLEQRIISGTPLASDAGNTYTKVFQNLDDNSTHKITIAILPSLTGLATNNGLLNTAFSPGTNDYTVTVPYATNTITITPTMDSATPSGEITVNTVLTPSGSASGTISLNPGANIITVVASATGTAGTLTNTYTVTVIREAIAVTAPLSQTVTAGQAATFSTTASQGTPGYTYQWQYSIDGINWDNVTTGQGYTTASYTTAATDLAMNGYQYRCKVTDSDMTPNVVYTTVATLTITSAITTLITEPESKSICFGGSHTFTVKADGTSLQYQWYKGNYPISGANANEYTITNATSADYERYYVVVKGADGQTLTSNRVTLWVADLLPQTLEFVEFPATVQTGKSYPVRLAGYPDVTNYAWSYSVPGVTFKPESGTKNETLVTFTAAAFGAGTLSVEMTHVCGNRTLTGSINVQYPTGIEDVEASGIRVYPNPVINELCIENEEHAINQVTISDVNGRIINTIRQNATHYKITAASWPKGVYFVRVTTESGTTTHKVIKR